MVWEWRLRRCFEDFVEVFEERGWEPCFRRAEIPPLVAHGGDCCILFDGWDERTGECRFELRDGSRRSAVLVWDVPTPERAAALLADAPQRA